MIQLLRQLPTLELRSADLKVPVFLFPSMLFLLPRMTYSNLVRVQRQPESHVKHAFTQSLTCDEISVQISLDVGKLAESKQFHQTDGFIAVEQQRI
jgi:hypothetical protein